MNNQLLKLENQSIKLFNKSALVKRGLEMIEVHRTSVSDDTGGLKKVGEFIQHKGPVYSVSISPDSKLAASAGEDRVIRLWSLQDFRQIQELNGHDSKVYTLAFSPDNRTLLSGGWDKTVRLWDIPSGKCLLTIRDHDRSINHISFSPDGISAITACADGKIYIWDLVGGTLIGNFIGHRGSVLSSIFENDGIHVVSTSDDQTVRFWNFDTKSEASVIDISPARPYCLSLAKEFLYVGYGGINSGIKQINLVTHEIKDFIDGHTKPIRTVSISPGNEFLVSGGEDNRLCFWKVGENSKPNKTMILPGWIWSLSFSPNEKLIVAGLGSGEVQIYQYVKEF